NRGQQSLVRAARRCPPAARPALGRNRIAAASQQDSRPALPAGPLPGTNGPPDAGGRGSVSPPPDPASPPAPPSVRRTTPWRGCPWTRVSPGRPARPAARWALGTPPRLRRTPTGWRRARAPTGQTAAWHTDDPDEPAFRGADRGARWDHRERARTARRAGVAGPQPSSRGCRRWSNRSSRE